MTAYLAGARAALGDVGVVLTAPVVTWDCSILILVFSPKEIQKEDIKADNNQTIICSLYENTDAAVFIQ